jgi:broad specificity phosphatase PhoE
VQLLLIRHGHPDYYTDSLTDQGHAEAMRLAEALDPFPIDAAYISSMGRAQQTAQYTLERRGMQGHVCHWLRELDGRYGPDISPAEWGPDDPAPSAYELHPADIMSRPELYSYEQWSDQVAYGPWMRPQLEALYTAFDGLLEAEGYMRCGLRYVVTRSSTRTLAFFCHGGVIDALLSHLLYIPLPVSLSLFLHETTGYSLLRTVEAGGHAAFRMMFLNSVAHKDVSRIARHP